MTPLRQFARGIHRSGTKGSNPFPSSGESTNHRFLGGGAASAVCHEPAPLYARAAANDAHNRGLQKARGGGAVPAARIAVPLVLLLPPLIVIRKDAENRTTTKSP